MDSKDAGLLRALAEAVIEEAAKNPAFSKKIAAILHYGNASGAGQYDRAKSAAPKPEPAAEGTTPKAASAKPAARRAGNRRDPAVLNPIEIAELGEQALTARLNELDEKQLKDIIAEFGMDQSKLAMKWRKKERLVGFIVERALARASKGDAFRVN